jgi:hypothetical protein
MGSKLDLNQVQLGNFASGRLAHAALNGPAARALFPGEGSEVNIPRWHPRITISRLFVLVSTLGLGTAKAVMSYRGDTIAPVTIEWITTIVLFLM